MKKILFFFLVLVFSFSLVACEDTIKDYAVTNQRPHNTCIPNNTYGSDIYTADLPSLKKMSGMVYRGGNFQNLKELQSVAQAGAKVITYIYGKKAFDGFEPIVVTENERANCWIIHGTPKDNLNTGLSFVAIKKDTGEVVMVLKNPDKIG